MKRLVWTFILFTVLMFGAFAYIYFKYEKIGNPRRNMGDYYLYLDKIYEEYNGGRSISDIEETYACDIILSSEGYDFATMTQYYSDFALIMDFAPSEENIGKIIWSDARDKYTDISSTLAYYIFILWLAVLIIGYIFIVSIYINLVRPINEMNKFANDVAKGNLDIPLPIHKNNLFGTFTESFDLMRDELKKSKEREAEAEKAKRELVAELSHDIKTPVATIKATCEVLEMNNMMMKQNATEDEAAKYDDIREKIGIISQKAETIDSLVSNLFHATLEELDVLVVSPDEYDSRMIESFVENMKAYGNIVMENHIPECLIYMDKLRMEQVIDNVIGNSNKYAGTEIRVSFKEITQGDGLNQKFIKMTIRDKGPGVLEEELSRITEKFFRGKGSETKQGSGLGLFLAKSFMERQGGAFEYYNDDGFVVELLIKKV